MAKKWKASLRAPDKTIKIQLNKAMSFVMADLDKWINRSLVKALVHGGFGIEGIADTEFYKFVSSSRGLSELGIEASEPPRLLEAYENSIKVRRSGRQLALQFGNDTFLKLATPHPAAGTGHLHVTSWLEFADGGLVNRGFVPRERLPEPAKKSIRLGDPLGGLMLPQGALGSSGLWRFPQQLQDYEKKWLSSNISKIENAILTKMVEFLAKRANG